MRRTLIHPVVLAKLSFNKEFDIEPISQFFWNQNDNLAKKIQPMLDKSLEVDKLLSSHSDSFDKFAQREILNDEYLNAIAQKIFDDGKKISLDQMPGTRNFLGCLVKLALVRIKGAELRHRSDKSLARIKIKSGDFGDLSHSFLPTLRRCILLRSRHGTNNSLNHEKTRKFVLI